MSCGIRTGAGDIWPVQALLLTNSGRSPTTCHPAAPAPHKHIGRGRHNLIMPRAIGLCGGPLHHSTADLGMHANRLYRREVQVVCCWTGAVDWKPRQVAIALTSGDKDGWEGIRPDLPAGRGARHWENVFPPCPGSLSQGVTHVGAQRWTFRSRHPRCRETHTGSSLAKVAHAYGEVPRPNSPRWERGAHPAVVVVACAVGVVAELTARLVCCRALCGQCRDLADYGGRSARQVESEEARTKAVGGPRGIGTLCWSLAQI